MKGFGKTKGSRGFIFSASLFSGAKRKVTQLLIWCPLRNLKIYPSLQCRVLKILLSGDFLDQGLEASKDELTV